MAWRKIKVFGSAARTASADSETFRTPSIERAIFFVDATASADTPSVVFTIRGLKPNPDNTTVETFDVLASAAVTAAGNTKLEVGPGITAAANAAASISMPPEWLVHAEAADGDSLTYSIGAWIYERD